jgi:hypothetical protein
VESSRADPRTGRLVDPGSSGRDGDAVEGPGVAGEVAVAEADATGADGGADSSAVVSGTGLVADAQAPTSRPARIVAATRESD